MKIIVAITSAGERTEQLSVELFKRQVDDVRIIKGYDRRGAVEKMLETGLEADALVFGASDLLVLPGMVDIFVSKLIKGGYDNLKGHTKMKIGIKKGGMQVFRSSVLSECLKKMKKVSKNKNEYKPLSACLRDVKMKTNRLDLVSVLHEYELDYKELYNRWKIMPDRNPGVAKKILPMAKRKKETDKDFQAVYEALTGKELSLESKEPITDFETIIKKYNLG